MIRALVVDDEPLARERLRTLLAEVPDVELIGECRNGADAVAAILEKQPDLVFLDVQMPELDGFQVLAALAGEVSPAVIFVTAYDEFALRAFDVHAIDYLLKPFERGRFLQAVEQATAYMEGAGGSRIQKRMISLLEEMSRRRQFPSRLVIRARGRVVFLPVTEVDWIESADNYVHVHSARGDFLMRDTLSHMAELLDPERFRRIHRSVIVNVHCIQEIVTLAGGDSIVRLENGTKLRSSRGYREQLKGLLEASI